MRERQFVSLCIAIVCAVLSVGIAAPVLAAQTAQPSPNVNIELKDTDVKSAIEALFRGTGKNYAIDANVTGTISALSIKDVSFDAALRSLTKSSGLVFRQDSGVYIISMRPDTTQLMSTSAPNALPETPAVEEPVASEIRIEKVPLSNCSASEILAILRGNNNNSGYGGYGSGYGGGYGGYGGGYGSSYGSSYGSGYGSGYGSYGGGYGSGYGSSGYNRGYGNSSYGSGYSSYGSNRSGYNNSSYRSW